MADMILYFFAALGVCFLVLECVRSFGSHAVLVRLSDGGDYNDLLRAVDDSTAPDIIILKSEESDRIIAALAAKYDKISVESLEHGDWSSRSER